MNSEQLSNNNSLQLRQPSLRKITPINIKIDKDTVVTTSLEEIKEALEKDFYKALGVGISIK